MSKLKRLVNNLRVIKLNSIWKFYVSVKNQRSDYQFWIKIEGIKNKFFLRKSDKNIIGYVFNSKYHLPVKEIKDTSVILDLGANIGATMVHFKNIYPKSKIFGYELDYDNYLMAKKNCSQYNDCTVIHGGVWWENSKIGYQKAETHKNDSFKIDNSNNVQEEFSVNTYTISSIINRHALEEVDYIKMDIEGAEKEVFFKGPIDWLKKVKQINIETHDFSAQEIEKLKKILIDNGFQLMNENREGTINAVQD